MLRFSGKRRKTYCSRARRRYHDRRCRWQPAEGERVSSEGRQQRPTQTYEHTLLERLELLVALDTLLLGETRVDRDRGEVALAKKAVELGGAADGLDEDDNLEWRAFRISRLGLKSEEAGGDEPG